MTGDYRLGLDLGTNSIGWCLLALDAAGRPCAVVDMGVRLMSANEEAGRDPQSKQSLAADRRVHRAARKRRDRFLKRRKRLMHLLIEAGLMPADEAARKALEAVDPYECRRAALDGPLDPHRIGRALFHLNQRRGFKSNRLAGHDKEDGATTAGKEKLKTLLAEGGARTLGDFLANRHDQRKTVRFRPRQEGAKVAYDLYPTRDMVTQEFEAIWAAQRPHHPATLTDDLKQKLHCVILEQRPLKPPPVGNCSLRPDERRAPRALPIFQRYRMLTELANLRVARHGRRDRWIRVQERDALLSKLMDAASKVEFDKLAKALKLGEDERFNLERGERKGLDPDHLNKVLGNKNAFGQKAWKAVAPDRRAALVDRLLSEEDPEAMDAWLADAFPELDAAGRDHVADARLPQGYSHLGRSALTDLVEIMKTESVEVHDPETGEVYRRPITYDEAVAKLPDGLHHSDRRPTGRLDRLPYYGDLPALKGNVVQNPKKDPESQEHRGRVPNPTVHIALNQVRLLVNRLISVYGRPKEIVVELGRELKLSREEKDRRTRENRENEKENEIIRSELAARGQQPTPGNRLLMRLYRELPADEKVCVYTGTVINCDRLFDGSIEIDHILPFSRTLDDGFANKVLCTRQSNRDKGNRAPAEAFEGRAGYDDEAMRERAHRILPRKAWRFEPDAMAKFEEKADFLARQLTDSQHIARLARRYLEHVSEPNAAWAVPGRLTAMLRGMWGLDSLLTDHNRPTPEEKKRKNRNDHRHHAIDAFVVACTDRGLLKRFSDAAARPEAVASQRLMSEVPEPFDGFRDQVRATLERIVVSHRPDHATNGQLHEDTAFGRVAEEIDGKAFNLVTRKPIDALSKREIDQVRDADLRERLRGVRDAAAAAGEKLETALAAFGRDAGVRRVRILKTEADPVTIRHGSDGRYHKSYARGQNHRMEIFARPGKNGETVWDGEAVSRFDAHSPKGRPIAWPDRYPDAELVMRVHKGDTVEADFDGTRKVYVVVRLSPSNGIVYLVGHNEAGTFQERHDDPADPFRWNFASYRKLQKAGARRVIVDAIGRVRPAVDKLRRPPKA